ncbi:SLAM family member 5-like isoform X2 [Rhinatrema bivittatum]|nr:SLAM family member 5-like isoform X2 [Rhinatrema bivittatum]
MQLKGILGGSVVFQPEIPEDSQVITVTWTHMATSKIIAVIRSNEDITVRDDRYQGRVETAGQSYALRMNGLKMDDSGFYRATIYSNLATMQRNYKLQVLQRVPDPDPKVTQVGGSGRGNIQGGILTHIVVGLLFSWLTLPK